MLYPQQYTKYIDKQTNTEINFVPLQIDNVQPFNSNNPNK